MLRNDQTLEPFAQSIGVQHFIGDALSQDLFLKRRQTHRRRPEIKVLLERVLCGVPALIAERITDRKGDATADRT